MSTKKSKIKSFNLSTQIEDGKIVKASVLKINESDLGKEVKVKLYSDVVSDGKEKIVAAEVMLKIGEAGTTIPPDPPQQCKEGEHWDAAQEKCVPDTVEPPVPVGDLILAGAGDNEDGPDADKVLGKIAAEKPTRYLFLGDSSYNDNDADKWIELVEKNGLSEIAIIIQGNHEHAESDAEACETDIENWKPYLKDTPEVNSNEPSWEKTKWISGQQVKNSYVIAMNSQDMDRDFPRNQFNWTDKQLEIAKALKAEGKIDWIVVLVHKPFYTLKTSHSPEKAMRDLFQPLFDKHQVDFVLSGHNHNVQNWLPLATNAKQLFVKKDGVYDFSQPHGQFYLVSGAGGHEHNAFREDPKNNRNVFVADQDHFAYTVISIKGKIATVLTKDSDANVLNQFTVTKGDTTIPPEPCPPNMHRDPVTGQCVEDTTEPPQQCKEGEHWDPAQGKCVPDTVEPPVGEFDENGVKLLYHPTGPTRKRPIEVGGNPSGRGQRYNADHPFKNYMAQSYFKTAVGQELIEMKTDGPCHGCSGHPAPIPLGMWYEPHLDLKTGKSSLHAEAPHSPRQDYHDLQTDFTKDIEGNINHEWIGYCVCAYTNAKGERVVEQWVDRHPFDGTGKPVNNWVCTLKATEKGDGKMFPLKANGIAVTFPRNLDDVINYKYGRGGLEAEYRMHGAESNEHGDPDGTDLKWGTVWEIIPPE